MRFAQKQKRTLTMDSFGRRNHKICIRRLYGASHELIHLCRFGHFVPLGLHVEVVVTTSNDLLGVEGTGKIYNASLTDETVLRIIQSCSSKAAFQFERQEF
jgi:hypothetical protein